MTYYEELEKARSEARTEFYAQNPLYKDIIDTVAITLPESAIDVDTECSLNNYTRALLASFVRTAFVSVELITTSELIEATTLNRKQIELLARLRELDVKEFEELIRQTPNLKYLKTRLKILYSPYSESAHSATYGSHSLLGILENTPRRRKIIFPEFTENTEIIFENWLHVFFEYTLWVLDYKTTNVLGYSKESDEEEFRRIYQLYEESGLKDRWNGKDNA